MFEPGDSVWAVEKTLCGGRQATRYVVLAVGEGSATLAWPSNLAVAGFLPLWRLYRDETEAHVAAAAADVAAEVTP